MKNYKNLLIIPFFAVCCFISLYVIPAEKTYAACSAYKDAASCRKAECLWERSGCKVLQKSNSSSDSSSQTNDDTQQSSDDAQQSSNDTQQTDTDNGIKDDFVGNLSCGGTAEEGRGLTFHANLPLLTSRIYDILKIATPVIVIITGMIDVLTAVSSQKEENMKKAQKKLLQRLLAGAIVFLIFMILEIVINIVAEKDTANNAMDCANCFLSNKCTEVQVP